MNPVILSDNLLARGTLTSPQGTDPNAPVSMVVDGRPYTRVKFTDPGTWNTIVVELPVAEACDTFALAGHNLTTGDIINRYYSDDGTTWTGAGAHTMTGSEDPIIFTTGTSAAHKWWRLAINTAASGNTTPEIGVAMIGTRLEFPAPPESPFVPEQITPVTEQTISKAGHLLGALERYQKVAINPTWKNLDRAWVENTLRPWWDAVAAKRLPFFWAFDLDAYPELVHYVRHTGGWQAPISVGGYVDQVALKLEGVL